MLSQPYLTLALTFPHWPSLLTNATLCSIASVPAIDSMFLFIRADSIAASAALLSAHVIYDHLVPPGQRPPTAFHELYGFENSLPDVASRSFRRRGEVGRTTTSTRTIYLGPH